MALAEYPVYLELTEGEDAAPGANTAYSLLRNDRGSSGGTQIMHGTLGVEGDVDALRFWANNFSIFTLKVVSDDPAADLVIRLIDSEGKRFPLWQGYGEHAPENHAYLAFDTREAYVSVESASGEWTGDYTLTYAHGATYAHGTEGRDNLQLPGYVNLYYAHAGNDNFSAGHGDDTLFAGEGNDWVDGGEDNDLIYGGEGQDTILGGSEDDLVFGGSDIDWLRGLDGNDTLQGGDGDDRLDGGAGFDVLIGGAGADTMTGYSGVTTVSYASASRGAVIDLGDHSLNAGAAVGDRLISIEIIAGSGFADALHSNSFDHRLAGNAGDDLLAGRGGADVLLGGDGADTLDGGRGDDRLEGGAGADVFTFTRAQGSDTLTGLEAEDLIRLALSASEAAALTLTQTAEGIRIDWGTPDSVLLLDTILTPEQIGLELV